MTQATEQLEKITVPGSLLAADLPRVDLLPPEIRVARRLRNVQTGMLAGVAAAVLVVGGLWLVADAEVQREQENLATAESRQVQVQKQVHSLAEVDRVYREVAARQALLSTAMGSEVQWSGYLNDLALRIPPGVWLSSIGVTPSAAPTGKAAASSAARVATISFSGSARSHNDVAVWLESLARQRGYVDAYFTTSSESSSGGTKTVTFSSSVSVTSEALSNRYAQKPGN
jgi:Tfp pilus assembly protein PilN